jgi:hypothetical protein
MKYRIPLMVLSIVCLTASTALAHGVNAHMWVSDRAVELLPEGDLKTMLSDPDIRQGLQIGSIFPDTGYAVSAPYGEPAHWEPFATAAVAYLKGNGYIPADTAEKKKIVAFFMGVANHGMEDEIFDTLFLRGSLENDNADQDVLDMVCDALLIADGHTKLQPPIYYPAAEAIAILKSIGVTATADQFKAGMEKTMNFAVIALSNLATETADGYRKDIPWTVKHYVDPDTAGSFGNEIVVIAKYMDYMWRRLNGTVGADEAYISVFPYEDKPIMGTKAGKVASWSAVFSGVAMNDHDIIKDIVGLYMVDTNLNADVARTRWSNGNGESRLFVVQPTADMLPCSEYEIKVASGMRLYDGRKLDAGFEAKVLSYCAVDDGSFADVKGDTGCCVDTGFPIDGGSDGGTASDGGTGESSGCSCATVTL